MVLRVFHQTQSFPVSGRRRHSKVSLNVLLGISPLLLLCLYDSIRSSRYDRPASSPKRFRTKNMQDGLLYLLVPNKHKRLSLDCSQSAN